MSEPRQCEEYPVVGHRCGLPRGHPGSHDIDPAPQDAWDWVDEKDEQISTLRRELAEAREELVEGQTRAARLRKEKEAAESALSEARAEVERLRVEAGEVALVLEQQDRTLEEARKESERYREALRAIETYEPEQEPTGTDTTGCEECAARRERQWPPSLLCEEHYREMAHARDRNTAARAHQHLRMRSIAHEALAASPRETAPAAAPHNPQDRKER